MKRVALILAVVGILCVSVGAAEAHNYHYGHHGHHGPVVVHPRVWVPPPVVVRPRVVYPPVYRYDYGYGYYDCPPSFGFQYHGNRVSIGVGF